MLYNVLILVKEILVLLEDYVDIFLGTCEHVARVVFLSSGSLLLLLSGSRSHLLNALNKLLRLLRSRFRNCLLLFRNLIFREGRSIRKSKSIDLSDFSVDMSHVLLLPSGICGPGLRILTLHLVCESVFILHEGNRSKVGNIGQTALIVILNYTVFSIVNEHHIFGLVLALAVVTVFTEAITGPSCINPVTQLLKVSLLSRLNLRLS